MTQEKVDELKRIIDRIKFCQEIIDKYNSGERMDKFVVELAKIELTNKSTELNVFLKLN